MTENARAIVVLAAGKGTRMKSDLPKVLHRLAGRPMLGHVLATAEALGPSRVVVVVGDAMEQVAAAAAPHETVIQSPQRGTGDALICAREALEDFDGTLVVLYADTPLIRPDTLERLVAAVEGQRAAVAVLGFRPGNGGAYGRLVVGEGAGLEAIIEYADASDAERRIDLCNSGVMAGDARTLFTLLDDLGNDNAKGEYYLTDVVALARARSLAAAYAEADADEVLGVNSRAELALAEALAQTRLRAEAMVAGATLIDPASVFLSWDTRLGRDVVIEPNVWIGPGVSVGDRVTIRASCHIEGPDVTVATGAVIGPFARLRPGTVIGEEAKVGNFVEIKQTTLGPGAKASHLSYLGDAEIGAHANIGAGTITCNYNGFAKARTRVGAGAFIGSNSALVAPVTIGDGAIVGAGSAISGDVPNDALALTRSKQEIRPGWAARFRERWSAKKGR